MVEAANRLGSGYGETDLPGLEVARPRPDFDIVRPVRTLAARALGAVLVLTALAAAGDAAAAAGEDEWQASLRLGLGTIHVDGRSPFGAIVGGDVEYGITDAWAAHLSATIGFHPVDADSKQMTPGGTLRATTAILGVTYTFDVLRLVPYIETGVGMMNLGGAVVHPGTSLSAELGLGADYLLTKRWVLGGILQYQFTPIELFGSAMDFGGTSYYFALCARLSRLF